MSVHSQWRWGAAAFVFGVVALLSGAHLCGAARDVGSRPLAEGGLACAEFWLNRYQTFLGAIAALLAGYAAWRGAMNQVARSDAQIVILGQQAAMDRVDYINTKLGPIDGIYRSMNSVEIWGNSAISKIPRLFENASEISATTLENNWSHKAIYDETYAPLLKDFVEELSLTSKYIDKLVKMQNEATLPEDVRDLLPQAVTQLAGYYSGILKFNDAVTPRMSITSSPEMVRAEYYRISQYNLEVPSPINTKSMEIYFIVARHRERLLILRNNAFGIAEA